MFKDLQTRRARLARPSRFPFTDALAGFTIGVSAALIIWSLAALTN